MPCVHAHRKCADNSAEEQVEQLQQQVAHLASIVRVKDEIIANMAAMTAVGR